MHPRARWINYEGHIEERLDGDEPAAGAPVGVATTVGDGAVVGLASLSHSLQTGATIAENVVSVLGKHARYARQSVIDVDWEATPDESGETETDTPQARRMHRLRVRRTTPPQEWASQLRW